MEDAFLAVVERTEAEVRAYIAAWGIPRCDVDDLAQEVYLDYYRAQDARPAEVLPVAWLKGIARNHCRHWLRSRGRRARLMAEVGEALQTAEDSPLSARTAGGDLLDALARCLERVPAAQRRLLERYYVEGVDAATLAGEACQSASGVRMALLRLREALRRCILAGAP